MLFTVKLFRVDDCQPQSDSINVCQPFLDSTGKPISTPCMYLFHSWYLPVGLQKLAFIQAEMSATSVFQNKFVSINKWHACEHQRHKALRNGGAKSKLGATNRDNLLYIDPYLGQKNFRAATIKLCSSPPCLKYMVHILTLSDAAFTTAGDTVMGKKISI